jgi:hypothetical protein
MGKRAIRAVKSRLTYANVAATLALVLAMSGGALAANHYLINSTKQINPKVLKKLRGARGALGPNGVVGPQGVEGPPGPRGGRGERGEPGFSALSVLPKGATESGAFAIAQPELEEGKFFEGAASFPIPLSAPIEGQVDIATVLTKTPHCLGPGQAERGWLCIYTKFVSANLEFERAYDPEMATEIEPPGRTGRFGFGLTFKVLKAEKPEPEEAYGTWSVTAP